MFFFSSSRRHTSVTCDWSSDVCSSDLCLIFTEPTLDAWKIDYRLIAEPLQFDEIGAHWTACRDAAVPGAILLRSEERRVGKECRFRWSAWHSNIQRADTDWWLTQRRCM